MAGSDYPMDTKFLTLSCCVRANFGWKLWASRDKVAQYVGIYFNPVKGFEF